MFGERLLSSSMSHLLLPYIKEEKKRLRMWRDSKLDKSKVAHALLATTSAKGWFAGRINESGTRRSKERYFSEELNEHSGQLAYDKLRELGKINEQDQSCLLVSLSSVIARKDISSTDDLLHGLCGKNYHRWQFFRKDALDFHVREENLGELFEQEIVELYHTEDNKFNRLLEQLEEDDANKP